MGAALAAFGVALVAELGDKSQLIAAGLGSRYGFWRVLAGTAVGFAIVSALAAAVGAALGNLLSESLVQGLAGFTMLGFALWSLREEDEEDEETADTEEVGTLAVVGAVAAAIAVGEIGDKTMFATASLAGQGSPVAVWIGATIGETTACALGIGVGNLIGQRLGPDTIRRIGAAAFALVGVVLLVQALT